MRKKYFMLGGNVVELIEKLIFALSLPQNDRKSIGRSFHFVTIVIGAGGSKSPFRGITEPLHFRKRDQQQNEGMEHELNIFPVEHGTMYHRTPESCSQFANGMLDGLS